MHPFVALMRKYCIDYTNSHDQSVCDDIMDPDYVVHLSGFDLPRDELYKPAVADLFARAPGLGLVVHEFIVNGDRLCMRFSEHAALPTADAGEQARPRLACWRGIGLYKWNGRRLTENYVEQDFFAQHRQLDYGQPDDLEPPHLDPWVATEVTGPDRAAEAAVRAWLDAGDVTAADRAYIDDASVDGGAGLVVDPDEIVVNDLFSAGRRVPFHVTVSGTYRGGLAGVPDEHQGERVSLQVAAIATVGDGGAVEEVRAVTTRQGVVSQLTGVLPV